VNLLREKNVVLEQDGDGGRLCPDALEAPGREVTSDLLATTPFRAESWYALGISRPWLSVDHCRVAELQTPSYFLYRTTVADERVGFIAQCNASSPSRVRVGQPLPFFASVRARNSLLLSRNRLPNAAVASCPCSRTTFPAY